MSAELAYSYAALILYDDNIDITVSLPPALVVPFSSLICLWVLRVSIDDRIVQLNY